MKLFGQNFQTQTKDLSFSASLSLNLCSSICFVFILFYFSSRYVIRWSILFCKRNSMNYELSTIKITDSRKLLTFEIRCYGREHFEDKGSRQHGR